MPADDHNPNQGQNKIADTLGRLRGDVMPPVTSRGAPLLSDHLAGASALRAEPSLGPTQSTSGPGDQAFNTSASYSTAGSGAGDMQSTSDMPAGGQSAHNDGNASGGSNFFNAITGGGKLASEIGAAEMGPPPLGNGYPRGENDEARRKRNRRLALIGGAVAVLVVVGFWIATRHHGDVPVISADATPEKVKPADQGGMQVPNQNVQVLENMSGQAKPQGGETVLPPPEQPVTPPAPATVDQSANQGVAPAVPTPAAVPSTDSTTSSNVGASGAPAVPAAPPVPPVPAATSAPQSTTPASTTPASTPPAADATAATSATTTTAAPTAPAAPVVGGNFRVQLAAVKSEEAAKAMWAKLQKTYAAQLGNLSLTVEKVDKGAQGVFYRVQAGPLADKAAAKSICSVLSQQGQACLIAH